MHLKSPNNKAVSASCWKLQRDMPLRYVCTSWKRNEIIIALSEAIISNFFLGGTRRVLWVRAHTLSLLGALARSITASLLAAWDDALFAAGRCIWDCRYSSYSVGNYCWCSALRYLISFLSKQQHKRGGRWLALCVLMMCDLPHRYNWGILDIADTFFILHSLPSNDIPALWNRREGLESVI